MIKSSINACVLAVLLLPGCAVLTGLDPAPLDTYDLTAVSSEMTGLRRTRTQVMVAEPMALKMLDGENIVVRPSASSIEFLAGAQWADRLPRIVQSRLVEALQASDGLGGVGKPGEGLAIDYQLVTEIRAFEVRLDGDARAEIDLYVKVLNDRNGVVRAARSFSAASPVAGTGNNAYAAALDQAFLQVSEEIVRWALQSL